MSRSPFLPLPSPHTKGISSLHGLLFDTLYPFFPELLGGLRCQARVQEITIMAIGIH